jgi:hypothetical protein
MKRSPYRFSTLAISSADTNRGRWSPAAESSACDTNHSLQGDPGGGQIYVSPWRCLGQSANLLWHSMQVFLLHHVIP